MPDVNFSNQYPYTDFHELNLDWVIKEVKYWSEKVGKTIQSIDKTGTAGLVDTYTITYSDGTTSTFDVTNGNGITSVAKTGTAGLVDTYTIMFQDGSTTTFEVHNGTASIDTTLTLSGYAADAKATGDAILNITSATRNLLPIQPAKSGDTTIDFGSDVTFANGVNISFDATNLTTSAPSASFIICRNNANTDVAIVTLNSMRNYDTGYVFSTESTHNGRHESNAVAALRSSITFRYVIIKYGRISGGSADNFMLTDGITPTPYVPFRATKDYELEQIVKPFDSAAVINSVSLMNPEYWDRSVDTYKNNQGSMIYSSGYFSTGLFPVRQGDTLKYKLSFANAQPLLFIYDENMQITSMVMATGGANYITGTKIFGSGECYFSFNGGMSYISNYELSYNDIPVSIQQYVENYVQNQNFFPSYWNTTIDNAVQDIKNGLLSLENGDCFVFITDQHWNSNAQYSSPLIDYIAKKTGIYNVFVGGDIVKSNNATQLGAFTEMTDYLGSFRNKDVRIFSTLGNHDGNHVAQGVPAAILNIDQQYNALIKPEEEWLDTEGTAYCNVYDNESQKIRYIQFWYTVDSGYNATVESKLTTAIESAGSGWTVIIMSHAYWTIQGGSDVVPTAATTYANAILASIDNTAATVPLWIVGHIHKDKTDTLTSTGGKTLRIISTTTDAYGQNPSSPSMSAGTTTEQAFDVYQIDTVNKTINIVRVGAGNDRNYSYV